MWRRQAIDKMMIMKQIKENWKFLLFVLISGLIGGYCIGLYFPAMMTEEMTKHPVPEELERAVNENLSEKPEPVIVSEPETAEEKPKSVAVSEAKGKPIPENELDNAKLRLRIIDLEEELKQAKAQWLA